MRSPEAEAALKTIQMQEATSRFVRYFYVKRRSGFGIPRGHRCLVAAVAAGMSAWISQQPTTGLAGFVSAPTPARTAQASHSRPLAAVRREGRNTYGYPGPCHR
jgi:hypothetical protein